MKKNILMGVAAVSALTIGLSACSAGTPQEASKKTLNVATMNQITKFDTTMASGSSMPLYQALYDTLIKREPDGTLSPMLATKWEYDDAKLALTLTLRTDVKFDDGSPLNADAVKQNLERFKQSSGFDATALKGVSSIETLGDSQLVINLDAPDPSFLWRLSDSIGLVANPASFADADSSGTAPDGTGPYELDAKASASGSKWVMVRAKDYWGDKLPFDTITFSIFDNENAIVNGLKTGQIDTAVVQSADQRAAIEQDSNLVIQDTNIDYQGLILFDRAGIIAPPLADPKVRQALNYAIDRDTMLKQIRGGLGETTNQIFSPQAPGYDKKLDSYYSFDPERAKKLLAEAGYPDGFDLPLPRLATIMDDALTTSLKTDFGNIGVRVVWDELDGATAIQRVYRDRAYPGLVMNLFQPDNNWLTITNQVLPGTFNLLGYTDDKSAELIKQIQNLPTEDSGKATRELNTYLVEQGWFVPFYRMTYALVTVKSVKAENQSSMAVPSIYNYAPAASQ